MGREAAACMPNLLEIAASAVGPGSCVRVVKLPEGQYNKVFQLTMSDGRDFIAKLPNPNAGRPHFTTASEVAIMDFVRAVFHFSCPHSFFLAIAMLTSLPCSWEISSISPFRECMHGAPARQSILLSRVYHLGEAGRCYAE